MRPLLQQLRKAAWAALTSLDGTRLKNLPGGSPAGGVTGRLRVESGAGNFVNERLRLDQQRRFCVQRHPLLAAKQR
jgi:hypothetical protein